MAPPDWQRVARAVQLRRGELGYARRQKELAELAGVGITTWRLIEGGKQADYSLPIKGAVCRALRWPSTALDDIADGGPVPPDIDPELDDRLRSLEEGFQEVQGDVGELRGLVERLLPEPPGEPS